MLKEDPGAGQFKYYDFHSHSKEECDVDVFRIKSFDVYEYIPYKKPFTIGIHPWMVSGDSHLQLGRLGEISLESNCMGIGEIGLDSSRGGDRHTQSKILTEQIMIANQTKKPLIFHIVKAYDTFEEFRKKYHNDLPWIIHGFSKNPTLAETFLKKNIYLSFGLRVLNSERYKNFFRQFSPEQYFLESDDSTWKIQTLFEKLSDITGLSILEISASQKKLYKKVFGSLFSYEF